MRKPTLLQQRTFEIIKDNRGISIGEAMRRAGYSHSTSLNPSRNFSDLKGTQAVEKDWQDLLYGKGLNLNYLARKYSELLEAVKYVQARNLGGETKLIPIPDNEIQFRVLESLKRDLCLGQGQNTEEKSVTYRWVKPGSS